MFLRRRLPQRCVHVASGAETKRSIKQPPGLAAKLLTETKTDHMCTPMLAMKGEENIFTVPERKSLRDNWVFTILFATRFLSISNIPKALHR